SGNFLRLELGEPDSPQAQEILPPLPDIDSGESAATHPTTSEENGELTVASLDAFRPLGERTPELAVAEAQRREFFAQLHRWLRQSYAVHVFCNNDGERQRFEEI